MHIYSFKWINLFIQFSAVNYCYFLPLMADLQKVVYKFTFYDTDQNPEGDGVQRTSNRLKGQFI